MFEAVVDRLEAVFLEEIGSIEDVTEPFVHRLRECRDINITVPGREDAVRGAPDPFAPGAFGKFAGLVVIRKPVGHPRDGHVEKRDIDERPLAIPVSLTDGREDRERRVRARSTVDEARPDAGRWSVGVAGYRHQPGERLNTRIVPGIRPVGTSSSESRERTVDDGFVSLDERLVIEIVLFEDAGAEAFDYYVGFSRDFGDYRFPLLGLEVHTQALFPVVKRHEHVAVHEVSEVIT